MGLGNLSNNAQVRADLVDAPGGILNSRISINANGTLSGAVRDRYLKLVLD